MRRAGASLGIQSQRSRRRAAAAVLMAAPAVRLMQEAAFSVFMVWSFPGYFMV